MSSKGKVGLAGVVTPWQSTVGRRRSRSILKLGSALVCVFIDWKEYFEHKNSCLCSVSRAPKTIFQYISPGSIPCTVILTIVLTSSFTIFHMFHISILFDSTSMLGGKIHLCRGWMGLGYWRWVEMGTHLSSTTSRRLTLAPQFCCVGLRSLPGRASLAWESLLRRAPGNLQWDFVFFSHKQVTELMCYF